MEDEPKTYRFHSIGAPFHAQGKRAVQFRARCEPLQVSHARGGAPATGFEGDAPLSPRVLVVDDDEAVRSLLRRLLESAGYGVETGAGGREGLGEGRAGERPRHPGRVVLFLRLVGRRKMENQWWTHLNSL